MTKDEALDLALEALEYIHKGANNQGPHTGISWRCVAVKAEPAITAIKQVRALDKKAENARELGLDYEPEERYTYGTPLLDAFTKPSPVQERDHGDELTIAYMSGVHRGKELARADEREACAKEADKWSKRDDDVGAFIGKAIRARGQE
jgi:hypothetical protein